MPGHVALSFEYTCLGRQTCSQAGPLLFREDLRPGLNHSWQKLENNRRGPLGARARSVSKPVEFFSDTRNGQIVHNHVHRGDQNTRLGGVLPQVAPIIRNLQAVRDLFHLRRVFGSFFIGLALPLESNESPAESAHLIQILQGRRPAEYVAKPFSFWHWVTSAAG